MRPNPFFPQLDGPHFLAIYITYIIVVLVAFLVIKLYLIKNSQSMAPYGFPVLDLYGIAYLRGSERGVLQTVVYRLYQLGYLTIEVKKIFGFITISEELVVTKRFQYDGRNSELDDFEIEILKIIFPEINMSQAIFSNADLMKCATAYCQNIQDRFQVQGLLCSMGLKVQQNILCVIGIGVMAIPGVLRLWGAYIANRPNVDFLIFSLAGSTLAGFFLLKQCRLSEFGNKVLANLKDKHQSGGDLAFIVAVTGLAALAGSEYTILRRFLGYGDSGGGCGGGGCGGGGCGGGCGG